MRPEAAELVSFVPSARGKLITSAKSEQIYPKDRRPSLWLHADLPRRSNYFWPFGLLCSRPRWRAEIVSVQR